MRQLRLRPPRHGRYWVVMRLPSAPPDLARTREALHAIAADVLAPARVQATGSEIALEATPGGFGTPPFPAGGRVRVEGAELVVEAAGGAEHRAPITTVRAAARLAGLDADGLPGDDLEIDPRAADFLGGFYAFAHAELESLRAGAEDPSPCICGRRTSTLPSTRVTRPPGSARATARRRATRTTPSPTSTSGRGGRPPRRRSGTPTASPAPSWRGPSS